MDNRQVISSTESTLAKYINEIAILGEENSKLCSQISLLKKDNEGLVLKIRSQSSEKNSEYKRLSDLLSNLDV